MTKKPRVRRCRYGQNEPTANGGRQYGCRLPRTHAVLGYDGGVWREGCAEHCTLMCASYVHEIGDGFQVWATDDPDFESTAAALRVRAALEDYEGK